MYEGKGTAGFPIWQSSRQRNVLDIPEAVGRASHSLSNLEAVGPGLRVPVRTQSLLYSSEGLSWCGDAGTKDNLVGAKEGQGGAFFCGGPETSTPRACEQVVVERY